MFQTQSQAPSFGGLGSSGLANNNANNNNNNTNTNNISNTTTNSFGFGAKKTNLFGNSQTTGLNTASALSGGNTGFNSNVGSSLSSGGFSLNKPSGTSSATSGLFGNTNNRPTLGGLGMQQQQPQQFQQSQQQFNGLSTIDGNGNPYGLNIPKTRTTQASTTTEMPKSLTPARKPTFNSSLLAQAKRKRSVSTTSVLHDFHSSSPNTSSTAVPSSPKTSKTFSFLKKLGNGIGLSGSAFENVSGIFSPSRQFTDDINASQQNKVNSNNSIHQLPLRKPRFGSGNSNGHGLSKSIGSRPDYRRLVVRHASGAFKDYKEIDPEEVVNKKRRILPNTTNDFYNDTLNSTNNNIDHKGNGNVHSNETRRPTPRFPSLFKDEEPEFTLNGTEKSDHNRKNRPTDFLKPNFQYSSPEYQDKDSMSFHLSSNPSSYTTGSSSASSSATTATNNNTNSKSDTSSRYKDGYWCVPSIEELSKLTPSELSHVENFTIGRLNHAQIEFSMPVDLTEFRDNWDSLLGKAVIFKSKTVQVYPEEYGVKRGEGNGLNVPAVITLENYFVLDKTTKQPIKDPLSPQVQQNIKKLRSQLGMKYIRYDCFNGTYTFSVQHFSIWGVVDEEDDDPELVAKFKRQQANESFQQESKSKIVSNAVDNIKQQRPELYTELTKFYPVSNSSENQEDQLNRFLLKKKITDSKRNFSPSLPGGWGYGQVVESDDDDDEGMTTPSSEEEDEEDEEEEVVGEDLLGGDDDNENDLYESYHNDRNNELMRLADDEVSVLISDNTIPNLDKEFEGVVDVKAYEPDVNDFDGMGMVIQEEFPVSDNWPNQLNLASGFYSIFNKDLRNSNDVELNPEGVNKVLFDQLPAPSEPKMIELPKYDLKTPKETESLINEIISKSNFEIRSSNGFPKIASPISFETILKHYQGTQRYPLWDLLSLLFDDSTVYSHLTDADKTSIEEDSRLESKFIELERKKLITSFLKDISRDIIEKMINSNSMDPLETIFVLICGNRLEKAAELAIASENPYLSVIISMVDSQDEVISTTASAQLEEWQRTNTLKHIPQPILKIYQLISGDILSHKYVQLTEGLDWSIVLNLMISYGNYDITDSLSDIINKLLQFSLDKKPEFNDVYYNALKLYTISHIDPSVLDIYNEESLDYTNEWLILFSLPYMFSAEKGKFKDEVILKFSEELKESKLFVQSIILLSSLNDDELAKSEILKILNSSIEDLKYLDSDSKLQELVDELHLPIDELYRSRGLKFYESKQFHDSTVSYLKSKDFNKAHEILLEEVAPLYIIASGYKIVKLEELINEFGSFVTGIESWSIGGGLYLKYIRLLHLIDTEDFRNEKESLYQLVKELLNDIPLLKTGDNHNIKVSKSLMLKQVIGLAIDLRFDLLKDEDDLKAYDLNLSDFNLFKNRLLN